VLCKVKFDILPLVPVAPAVENVHLPFVLLLRDLVESDLIGIIKQPRLAGIIAFLEPSISTPGIERPLGM
jgi:hypothetical protein